MENKDIVIIALIVVAIYLYYQQENKPMLVKIDSQVKEIQELQTKANHYQTLYQKRVEKDLANENLLNGQSLAEIIQQRDNYQEIQPLFEQKITDLETALFNLAKQKIKGKKDAEQLLKQLENNWKSDKDNWTQEKETLTANWTQQQQAWHQDKNNLITEHDQAKRQWQSELQEKDQQLASKNQDYNDLSVKQENSVKTIANWQQKEQEWKQELAEKQQALTEFNQTLLTQEEAIKQLQSEKEQQEQTIQTANHNLVLAQTEIQKLEKKAQIDQDQLQQLGQTKQELTQELQAKKNWGDDNLPQVKAKDQQISALEKQLTSQKELAEKIRLTEAQVFTEDYNKQPPHLRLLEHRRTVQEWLDGKYPDANARKYVTRISSYRINSERRGWDIKWNLAGGSLDLTKYKNIETIYIEPYELATPLTEVDITNCKKVRRIYLGGSFCSNEAKGIIKSHLTQEELEKIIRETDEDIERRKVGGEV